MNKGYLNTIRIQKSENQTLKNVASISFENMAATECYIEYNGFKRTLPPAQTVSGVLVPVSFNISGEGFVFDFSVKVTFPGATGDLYINTIQVNKE